MCPMNAIACLAELVGSGGREEKGVGRGGREGGVLFCFFVYSFFFIIKSS